MKPANKSEHRLLQSSTLLLSLVGRILKMWVCKIQDLKIIALNIFPKIKQLLTYFFKKQIRSPSQWQLSDSCLSLLCSDSTTFSGMRFKDIRTMTTCPIIAKYKNNWHTSLYLAKRSQKNIGVCSSWEDACALQKSAALGAQKEERNTRPIANPSQLKSFQHKVEVI